MWSRIMCLSALLIFQFPVAFATEQLVIATSPSMRVPVEALGRQFEKMHPEIKVRLYFDSGLDLRRTIAGMENNPRGQYFIGSGPLHLVAPGGDAVRRVRITLAPETLALEVIGAPLGDTGRAHDQLATTSPRATGCPDSA